MIRGEVSSSLNANLTSITHIPEARLVITVRIEASLFSRSLNLPSGQTDVVYPTAYLTVEDGGQTLHFFTDRNKEQDEFRDLVVRPSKRLPFLPGRIRCVRFGQPERHQGDRRRGEPVVLRQQLHQRPALCGLHGYRGRRHFHAGLLLRPYMQN